MKEVIRIGEVVQESEKPVKFTHYLHDEEGWIENKVLNVFTGFIKIVYLGRCCVDGDMFSTYTHTNGISIYKGHLNSGKY
jgi:hypothetical protein